MIPIWSWRNAEHLQKHDVATEEADEIVWTAKPPYPENLGDAKWAVRGKTEKGRWLQVIFLYVTLADVEADEYAELRLASGSRWRRAQRRFASFMRAT